MTTSVTPEIDVQRDGAVQVIRLNRPDKKNALTGAMYEAISAALDAGDWDDDVACNLFVGSGGTFSAGNDLKDFMSRDEDAPEGIPSPALEFISRLPNVQKPMIAAVDGLAVGIGTTMLFHCDLVYASPSASLRTPFLNLGLVPEAGSSLTAVTRMGYARAFELLCLGEPFNAERALAAGIVNAIVPAAELEAAAMAAAQRLAAKPREALIAARRLLRGDSGAISSQIGIEAKAFAERMASHEAQEAFAAFFEKRPPDFAKARRK